MASPASLQKKREVQAFHEGRAAQYYQQGYASRNTDTLVKAHVLRQVVDMLEPAQGEGRALDLGCGPGILALPLLEKGYEYWGTDLAKGMVQEARRRLPPEVRLLVGDAEHLALPDEHFDVVTCVQVLDYLPRDEVVLGEIRRVLKPGGCAVLTVVVWASLAYLAKRGLGWIVGLAPVKRSLGGRRRLRYYPNTRGILPWSFRHRLNRAGLVVERTAWANLVNIPVNFPLPGPLYPLLGRLESLLARSPLRGLGAIMIVKARRPSRP